jgi:transketolase
VRKEGEMPTLNVQHVNTRKLYRTGTYDLEFLTLPRLAIPDVVVKQSGTTPVRIPQNGTLNVVAGAPGFGAVFVKEGSELKWVIDLDPNVARHQFRLLPGDYKVIYRSANANQTIFSTEKDVTVKSGQAITLDLSPTAPMNYPVLDQKDTRSGFGAGLSELGKSNPNVVALCADLTGSLKMDAFAKAHPERFFQVGIAEANMMGIAAGLTIGGKIPFTGTFANFSTGRVYDQIRQSIAYAGKNVKICASHAGLTLGEDGATHQILEDIGLMRMLPGMTVIVPCDFNQTKQATIAIAAHEGPVYLRFGRPKWPVFIPADMPFQIGKAQRLIEGKDVSVFACGHLVWKALQAAEELEKKGISAEVINVHTIKPLDEEAVLASVRKTKCVVTCEEHNRFGGLGDTIAQALARTLPTPQEYVAVNDSFGESGTPDQLLKKYGLDTPDIVKAAERVVARRS